MTTAKTYDYLNRLQNITSTPSASGKSTVAFDYAYNDVNQRTRVNMADGSCWIFEYDALGQVTRRHAHDPHQIREPVAVQLNLINKGLK